MAYTINLTDGTIFATVADGTINTDSSLTVVGKNYAGYGEFLNENMIKLLESGANTTQPSAPLTGQLWFDKSAGLLKVYNGSTFKNLGSATSSASAPSSNVTGDLWFDSTNSQLKVYDGASWILVGPAFTAGTGTSGAIVDTIEDTGGTDHVVVKMFVEDSIVTIVSKDATFTPSVAISGFATIGPGVNMSSTVSNAIFNGKAANAEQLDGIDSTGFLSATANDTTSGTLGVLNDTGLAVGVDSDMRVSVSGSDVTIANQTSDGDLKLSVNDGGSQTTVINIDGATSSFNPGANATVNMGTSSLKYNTIYAVEFNGTATTAEYADLAERFEADAEYQPGTVVELGGAKEITSATGELSDEVFGVISTRAAYLMNAGAGSDATHPPVAMSGRVPVRVIGAVNKGDRLVSAGNGLARAALKTEVNNFNVIGRALETKYSEEEGTVEAIVAIVH
jgi:hypothetical protein